jgi:hypothetical protein
MPDYNRQRPGKTKGYAYTGKMAGTTKKKATTTKRKMAKSKMKKSNSYA